MRRRSRRASRRGSWRFGWVVVVAVAAVVSLGLFGACGSPRTSLGTDASACFRALPAARQAVHDRGRLVGVRHVSANHASRIVPHGDAHVDGAVCLVAFRGPYQSGSVDAVVRADGSEFAIVAIDLDPKPRRLGCVLVDHLPARFSHL